MKVWAIDIETTGLVPWQHQILGVGVASDGVFSKTRYYDGDSVSKIVRYLHTQQIPVVGHNILFDKGWLDYHYPEHPLNWVADTGVLSQMYDNSDFVHGFGLKDSAQRLLGVDAHEEELQVWVLTNVEGAKKSEYRAHMEKVPTELVAKYCRYDCLYTYRLFELLSNQVDGWQSYMNLFLSEVDATIQQQRYGIKVNLEGMQKYLDGLVALVDSVAQEFLNHPEIAPHIQLSMQIRFSKECNDKIAKSKTGRVKLLQYDDWCAKYPFNINSDKQLLEVFNSQGLFFNPITKQFNYPFLTEKGKASLSKDFIALYGVGGQILAKQGEIGSMVNHAKHVVEETVDGRVHPSINLIGTKSGRISATGMNILAVPFDEHAFASNFLADDGCIIWTNDALSLEPVVMANLSGDKRLSLTCTQLDAPPIWDHDGFLCVDDVYTLVGSKTSFAGPEIRAKVDPMQWFQNSDACKKSYKATRNMLKTIILAIAYGAGPKKIQMQIFAKTKQWLPLSTIKETIDIYYQAFPRVRAYGLKLATLAEKEGRFVNPFGFPLSFSSRELNKDDEGEAVPKFYKAINRITQSTAQGVMKLLIAALQSRVRNYDPQLLRFVLANFHDAFFLSVHESVVEDCKQIVDDSLQEVNQTLLGIGWQIPMRLSTGYGDTLYAAKTMS